MKQTPFAPVAIARCERYEKERILACLREYAPQIGLTEEAIRDQKVVLKPNLLLAYAPEKAATTHPAVMEAIIDYLKELSPRSLLIAESPGGIYSERSLRHTYDATGMRGVSERSGVPLNYDISYRPLSLPNGRIAKSVDCITPIDEADVIVNVCKLKTHALATMTAASKNLFGVIPGIHKFEMHARFKKPTDFFTMVIDLNEALAAKKTVFHLCDAVIGMEGDGPSGGTPKAANRLLMSQNPFCLDLAAAELMGLTGRVELLTLAAERGLCPTSWQELTCHGLSPDRRDGDPFLLPDAKKGRRFDLIPPFLQPRPKIDRNLCRGCRQCVESCPQKTIIMQNGKAKILPANCIKCYCCQELCIFRAVRIHKSFIYRMVEG